MSACEKCWSEATRRAYLKGGSVAEHYPIVLAENDAKHAEPAPKEAL